MKSNDKLTNPSEYSQPTYDYICSQKWSARGREGEREREREGEMVYPMDDTLYKIVYPINDTRE